MSGPVDTNMLLYASDRSSEQYPRPTAFWRNAGRDLKSFASRGRF
jgi:hypothetical protein